MSEKDRDRIVRDVVAVANALGASAGDALLIGGAALALYPHPAGDEFRGTDDVDCVVRVERRDDPFRRRLEHAGFSERRDAMNRARRVLRTLQGETDVDIVFADELSAVQKTLIEDAFVRAVPTVIDGIPLSLKLVPPVNFIGLKLLAAESRGRENDFKDVIDVADVLGNQPEIRAVLEGAEVIPSLVREGLITHRDLIIRLAPQAFRGDAESQRRAAEVAEWLEDIAQTWT